MGINLAVSQPDSEQAVTDTNVRTATTRKDEPDVLTQAIGKLVMGFG